VDGLYFENQPDDIQDKILNYELMVYVCTGKTSEKLAWFERVNIAGEKLTPQELLNSAYTGAWLSDAKRYFSKTGGPAYNLAKDHVSGKPIRQKLLEEALKWISQDNIRDYMGKHQNDENARELWEYFKSVIEWVKSTFETRPKLMNSLDWGRLHREHGNRKWNPKTIEKEIAKLLSDPDVTNQKGVYEYILTRDERHLNIRLFDERTKRRVYEKQEGRCKITKEKTPYEEMEADHITPWSKGGQTIEENCQMLSKEGHILKGATG